MPIYVGGGSVGGTINDAATSSTTTWSSQKISLISSGSISPGDSATLDNLILLGDLTVNGTTTNINSTVVNVVDETIELNSDRHVITTGGLKVLRNPTGEASMLFDEASASWVASHPVVLPGAPTVDLQAATKLYVDTATASLTAAGVKILYESNTDTNAYDDADRDIVGNFALVGAPELPVLVSTSDDFASSYRATACSAGGCLYAFVAVSGNGLAVYDTSDAKAPIYYAGASGSPTYTIGDLDPGGTCYETAITASGDYLYATFGGAGLRVYNISGIASGTITLVGTPITTTGSFQGIAIDAAKCYVAAGTQGVRTIDASTEAAPTEVGFYDGGGGYVSVAVIDANSVASSRTGATEIINTTTMASPSLVVAIAESGGSSGVAVSGTTLFTCRKSSNGYQSYDISTPAVPVLEAADTTFTANDVIAAGGYAYVAENGNNLRVYDATATGGGAVTPLNTITSATDPMGVTLNGSNTVLWVSDGAQGLRAYTLESGVGVGANFDVGGTLLVDVVTEMTPAAGVLIEGVLLKDGLVDGVDIGSLPSGSYLPLAGGTMTGAIELTDGTQGAPSLTFATDSDTGLYRTTANTLGFTTGGAGRMSISSQRADYQVPLRTLWGTAVIPPHSFSGGGEDTGLFYTTNTLGVTVAGVSRLEVSTTAVTSSLPVLTDTISETTPGAGVTIDTVLIKDGLVDGVDVSTLSGGPFLPLTGGTLSGGLTTTQVVHSGGTGTFMHVPSADTDTGLYWVGANRVGLGAGGVVPLIVEGSLISITRQFQAHDGSVGAPSVSFSNATDRGLYNSTNGLYVSNFAATLARLYLHDSGVTYAAGDFLPETGGGEMLGASARRWSEMWCTQASINTASDSRIKNSVLDGTLGLAFVESLRPVSYILNDDVTYSPDDPTLETGRVSHTRRHEGLIAQEVLGAITAAGLTTTDTDLVGIDEDPSFPGGLHSVRYGALVMPLIAAVKELSAANTALMARVAALEAA